MADLPPPYSENDTEITRRLKPIPFIKGNSQNNLMVVIVVLLTIQILISGYQLIHDLAHDRQAAAEQEVVSKSIASYTQNLDELTNRMLDDYKSSVYNNSLVDTTSKQVVMGTEYNFNAIMLLIKQNSRLMELIAESK